MFRHPHFKLRGAVQPVRLFPSLPAALHVHCQINTFTFLNIKHDFKDNINWNESRYGKLWTYNLTYFEFLHSSRVTKSDGLRLIHDFIDQIEDIKDGVEPFPTALRIMNWIKFVGQHNIWDGKIDRSLYQQTHLLLDQLEYHLLGNHLLENGFALFFAAYYFQSNEFYAAAKKILEPELEEQILADGVHFELSPMYHQWMLYRVLDCCNLIKRQDFFDDTLNDTLRSKASLMLGALEQLTFLSGDIALLNDSAFDIAPTSRELLEYARRLNIEKKSVKLKESGYRRINKGRYELLIDIGEIGPTYIPGHAHCDMLSFVLYVGGAPFIVDTGTSTYEANDTRQQERSTAAHNTVMVNDKEQSEIWSAFRVANRARIVEIKEGDNWVEATHNGYQEMGIYHRRRFEWTADQIVIKDFIQSKGETDHKATAYLHFAPAVFVQLDKRNIETQKGSVTFATESTIDSEQSIYQFAPTFNRTVEAIRVDIHFDRHLETRINI
ncbi:MAG: alginate lyase family protein [Bacteroidota bacterium]